MIFLIHRIGSSIKNTIVCVVIFRSIFLRKLAVRDFENNILTVKQGYSYIAVIVTVILKVCFQNTP